MSDSTQTTEKAEVTQRVEEMKAITQVLDDKEKEVPKVRRFTRWAILYFYLSLFISVGVLMFSTGIMDMGVDIMNGTTGRTVASFFGMAFLVLAPIPFIFKMENSMVKGKNGKFYNPNWKMPLLSIVMSTVALVLFILSIAVF